jgi:hypothetical protein
VVRRRLRPSARTAIAALTSTRPII